MVTDLFSSPTRPPVESEAAGTPLADLVAPCVRDVGGLWCSDRHILELGVLRLEQMLARPAVLADVTPAVLGDLRDRLTVSGHPAIARMVSAALDRLRRWAWQQFRYELLRCAKALREDAKRAALCR